MNYYILFINYLYNLFLVLLHHSPAIVRNAPVSGADIRAFRKAVYLIIFQITGYRVI